jgi:hypothetical protein
MKKYIAIAFCFGTCIAHAQLVDSAFGYMPLMIGNMWEYNYRSLFPNTHLYYFTETVSGDSVAANGIRYFVIHSKILPDSSTFDYLERVDSVTANLYTYQPTPFPTETLIDSLRSKPGDRYNGDIGVCISQQTKTILGVPATVKSFSFGGLATYEFAYGLGKDSVVTYNDGNTQESKLIYARIAGKEYGTLLSVPSMKIEPVDFLLLQNFPNPFNPSTTIEFSLNRMQYVSLEVSNTLGQRIAILVARVIPSGLHIITFDGSVLPTGTYYYTLRTLNSSITKPMLLIK